MSDFKAQQRAFAAYLRDPQQAAAPADVEARRLAVYRRLIRNNIESFLRSGFPVVKSVLTRVQWQKLMDDFIREHPSHSPFFSDIGAEFVAYLAQQPTAVEDVPDYLYELAYYERMELEVQLSSIDPALQWLAEPQPMAAWQEVTWRLNPALRFAHFRYPVAWLNAEKSAELCHPEVVNKDGYWLLVYRPPKQDDTQFMQLNPLTAVLLSKLQEAPHGLSITELVVLMQQQLAEPSMGLTATQIAAGIEQTCQQFAVRGVLLAQP